MTNIAAIVVISFTTNLTENIHQDGTRMTVVETVRKQCVHEWIEGRQTHNHTNFTIHRETIRRYRRVWEPIETTPVLPSPPMPLSPPMPVAPLRAMFVPSSITEPIPITGQFRPPDPDEDESCRMFAVTFPTVTNQVYRFEGTLDLATWEYLQPEINGTGEPDTFYDVQDSFKAYRVASREGVIPEE